MTSGIDTRDQRRHRTTRSGPTPVPLPPAEPVEALVCVQRSAMTSVAEFEAYLRAVPAVTAAWWVAADVDVIVRLSCPSLAALDAAVSDLRLRGGAAHTVTHLVLRPLNPTRSTT